MQDAGPPVSRAARLAGCLAVLAALGATGCGSLNVFSFGGTNTERSKLLDSAKALREAFPPPQPLPRELEKTVMPPYVVEPGDVLLVQALEPDPPTRRAADADVLPETLPVRLPADQPVLPDGTIDLGRYGRLVVAGRRVDEIEAMIKAAVRAVRPNDNSYINVRIVSRVSKVFYVLGEVNAPNSYPLDGRETVLDALMKAGGVTNNASLDNIILSRPTTPDGCRKVLPICYRQIVQLGDTSTNYQIQPGDRIFVPSKAFCEHASSKTCSLCNTPQTACPLDCDHPGPPHPLPPGQPPAVGPAVPVGPILPPGTPVSGLPPTGPVLGPAATLQGATGPPTLPPVPLQPGP
jgi:protein involved in polysaccharide export with SLBB domain